MSNGTMPRVALITGCSEPHSLGASLALDLLARGWKVIATARKLETLKDLEAAGCLVISLDVTSDESVRQAARIVRDHSDDKLDLLINNAGIAALGPVVDLDVEKVKQIYDVNVFGAIRMVQAFTPLLIRANLENEKHGTMGQVGQSRIINIGSASVFLPPWQGAYGSSKAAMVALSNSMRVELGRLGINVILIHLVLAKTAMTSAQKPFDVLKAEPSGLIPWTGNIGPKVGQQTVEQGAKAPSSIDVAKDILDVALVRSPPREMYSGAQKGFVKWFLPFLPTFVFDKVVAQFGFLDLIPKPTA